MQLTQVKLSNVQSHVYLLHQRFCHLMSSFNPSPPKKKKKKKIDSSKQKEYADDNFKFDENGRNVLKQVEHTVGKGEIARFSVFSKDLYCRHVKTRACLGKG